MIDETLVLELKQRFRDVLNHEADDPLTPINPLTYRSPEGDSCLHLAAIRGDLRAAQLLIEAGLDVNGKGDLGNTPLHYAVQHHHKTVADLLIANGASRSVVNEFGKTPSI